MFLVRIMQRLLFYKGQSQIPGRNFPFLREDLSVWSLWKIHAHLGEVYQFFNEEINTLLYSSVIIEIIVPFKVKSEYPFFVPTQDCCSIFAFRDEWGPLIFHWKNLSQRIQAGTREICFPNEDGVIDWGPRMRNIQKKGGGLKREGQQRKGTQMFLLM